MDHCLALAKILEGENNQAAQESWSGSAWIKKWDGVPKAPEVILGSQNQQIFLKEVKSLCADPKKPKGNLVVQKYIREPLLVNNHKFILKYLVFLPSVDPIVLHLSQEPVAVRVCQKDYDPDHFDVILS